MITTIGFDIGGVYLTDCWGFNVMVEISQKFNIPMQKIKSAHDKFQDDLSTAKLTPKQFVGKFAQNSAQVEQINDFILESNKVIYPELWDLMLRLKQNYRMVILNNEGTDWNEYRIKKFKLGEIFPERLTSCIIHEAKPHLAYFKKALSRLRIKPEELLFIDNSEENVKQASKLRIQTIHFKNPRQLKKELKGFHIPI